MTEKFQIQTAIVNSAEHGDITATNCNGSHEQSKKNPQFCSIELQETPNYCIEWKNNINKFEDKEDNLMGKIEDVEEGEISDSASVEEVTEEDFKCKGLIVR